MNNKTLLTIALVGAVAVVAYMVWKQKQITAKPPVSNSNGAGGTTTPTPTGGSGSGIGGVIDTVNQAWDSLTGLFGNQSPQG